MKKKNNNPTLKELKLNGLYFALGYLCHMQPVEYTRPHFTAAVVGQSRTCEIFIYGGKNKKRLPCRDCTTLWFQHPQKTTLWGFNLVPKSSRRTAERENNAPVNKTTRIFGCRLCGQTCFARLSSDCQIIAACSQFYL